MAWAPMEADNPQHDGTQDDRTAVRSGSPPRRSEVRHRASRQWGAYRPSRCQGA